MVHNSGRPDRRTSRQSRKHHHPYEELEGTPVWNRVDRAVKALLKNGDLELTTRREYVVGYICQNIGRDSRRKSITNSTRARRSVRP
jgi:hypothetical protein